MNLPWNRTHDSDPADEPETETVEVEKTMSYTEHDGIARFVDGTEREYTFDAMEHNDGGIVLKDYTSVRDSAHPYGGKIFGKRPFVTIPYANLKDFETTTRRDREMSYTTTEEREVTADE